MLLISNVNMVFDRNVRLQIQGLARAHSMRNKIKDVS